jgi:hypothetical protein
MSLDLFVCVCVCVCFFSDSSDTMLIVSAAETCNDLLACTNIHLVAVFKCKNC